MHKNLAAALLCVAGLELALAPWAFDYIDMEAAAFSSKVIAAGLLLVALAAYVELREWAIRGAVVAALCSFVAPILLDFDNLAAAAWTYAGAGALALVAALALVGARRAAPTRSLLAHSSDGFPGERPSHQ
jgi:SPW repeat